MRAASGPAVIRGEMFLSLIGGRTREILGLAKYIEACVDDDGCFTRPLLGDLLSEASKLEELLDAYGAQNNRRWYIFRQLIASAKLFSYVGYTFLHIKHSLPVYHLLPVHANFEQATDRALEFVRRTTVWIARSLLAAAKGLELGIPEETPRAQRFSEELPPGHLPFDRETAKIVSPEETVVYLSTAFLNLVEESKILHVSRKYRAAEYPSLIPDPISEEKLRTFEQDFHNLQSLYDTYISDSNVETLDEDLTVLRGHITVIYHLLEAATALAHYYERHLAGSEAKKNPLERIDSARLLQVLVRYTLGFSSRYILKARTLCHLMLKKYAKQGKIEVDIPRYRGFHVRPSTLLARIVSHYGSKVTMKMSGESYNAGVTLDLFRANEKINASKRRFIADEVARVHTTCKYRESDDMLGAVRSIIHTLFEEKKLFLTNQDFSLKEIDPLQDETECQYAVRVVMRLFTMEKIDIPIAMKVVFSGDRRVLDDIKLLAENGYGEDSFGNNLALPRKLQYLRR
jgi:hypothetical protein